MCHACASQVTALTSLVRVHRNPSTKGDRCRHSAFQGVLGSRTQATCENVWLEVAMKLISGAVVVVALWPHEQMAENWTRSLRNQISVAARSCFVARVRTPLSQNLKP